MNGNIPPDGTVVRALGQPPSIGFCRRKDPNGRISYPWFSETVRDVLGYSPEEMAVDATGGLDVVHWADRDDHLEVISRSATELAPCAEEFRVVTANGDVRWLKGISRPHRQQDGGTLWDGLLLDVTEGRRSQARLELMSMESGADAMFLLDASGTFKMVNAATLALFGYAETELDGQHFGAILSECSRRDMFARGCVVKGGACEAEGCRKDGTTFPLELSINAAKLDGQTLFIGIGRDITRIKQTESALRETEERLSFLAFHDPLTHLPNRIAFIEGFAAFRGKASMDGEVIAILCLGVDRFSIINATMGRDVGDLVLRALADHLLSLVGNGGAVARSSGERFLVLLTGYRAKAELEEAIERLHHQLQAGVTIAEDEIDLTVSIGVAIWPENGDDLEILIRHADAAFHQAKARGTAMLQYFSGEMTKASARALCLQARLRHAIERGELVPFFQPQVELLSGRIVGMEALARWISPELGMVSPGEFIPVAEKCGLIDNVCEIMLNESVRQNREWQRQGLPAIPVAVNVSGRQFQSPRRLLQTVDKALAETGLEPRYLEIELTESSAMGDPENAIALVRKLHDIGVSCSIDDFGTGYSSLAVLKSFPLDKLKIDRSFVLDIASGPNEAAIVEAIIAMAKALKLHVVAEGVEDSAQVVTLRSLGCNLIQGYYFSKPLDAEGMKALLATGCKLNID